MTSQNIRAIKDRLKMWGKGSNIISLHTDELAAFKAACNEIENAQGAGCEVINIEELRQRAERLGKCIDNNLNAKIQLDEIIAKMPCIMQEILRAKYVKGIKWDFIPMRLSATMSERQCFRLHRQAIEFIYEHTKRG